MQHLLQPIAAQLLLQIKKQENPQTLLEQLSSFPASSLRDELQTEPQKKAFWINCYNAFFLHLRRDHKVEKPYIYRQRLCHIAQHVLSLDEIEHGILRRYRAKLGLGYLPNLSTPRYIRSLAVKHIDFRVHFTLNCGAVSCPPIAFYKTEQLEKQLETATLSFLEAETSYDETHNEIHFTRLGCWYLADFGGHTGIRQIVRQYLNKGRSNSKIKFRDYNWEENLDNFVDY